jgi:hypothetical protein
MHVCEKMRLRCILSHKMSTTKRSSSEEFEEAAGESSEAGFCFIPAVASSHSSLLADWVAVET